MFRKTGRGKSTGAANGNGSDNNADGSVSVKEGKNDDDNNDNDNDNIMPPPPPSTMTTTNGDQQQPYRHDEALIYSTPTVDTLNDESGALSRFYLSPQNNPNNVNKSSTMYLTQDDNINNNHDMISTTRESLSMPSINNNNNPSTVKVAATHKVGINHSGRRLLEESGHKKNNNNNNSNSRKKSKKELQQEQRHRILIQHQQQKKLRRQQRAKNNENKKSSNNNGNNKEFQCEDDAMSVTVRLVCVAERTAFDKKLPPYLVTLGGDNENSSESTSNNSSRKMSPSLQHWRVLQQLSSVTHVRQLVFSHSVGSAVDVFWREELEEEEEEDNNRSNNLIRDNNDTTWGNNNDNNVDSNHRKKRRDGRYRSIDPVRATTAALPKDPPLLSNKKHRLPMRTDVGFPNASAEEISQKQEEIRCETQWEEASPRLVVLVTGDDLGKAVEEDYEDDFDENDNDSIHGNTNKNKEDRKGRNKKRRRNPGLPGMPFAGKDLIRAKERNNRHFSRRHESSRDDAVERATNMLAPPLDAIYSGTLGWRPRPFHDRPPGLRYTLGKLSEEFYFPAGDWRGKLQLDALQDQSRNHHHNKDDKTNIDKNGEDASLLTQLWNQRKHKAIFAHSSLTGNVETDDDLYVVLQVYKVTHKDSITAYWAKGGNNNSNSYDITSSSSSDRKTLRKKLKNKLFQKDSMKKSKSARFNSDTTITADETDIEKALLRSNATFEAYGTQFMSPLCFGITSLFPEDSHASSRNNTWPRGQVQQGMNLHAFPSHSESQEDFLRRLRKVVSPTIQPVGIDDTTEASGLLKSVSSLSGVTRGISGGGGDNQSVSSASQFPDSSSIELASPLKRKGSVRRFMTPRRMSKRDLGSSNPKISSSVSLSSSMTTDRNIEDTPLIPGSATLFTSNLDVDFLQSMLITPPELKDKISVKTSGSSQSKGGSGKGDSDQSRELVLPRILVDVSGDSAIMIDPKKTNTGMPSASSAKRSDLVRLPSTRLAEHMDSSEFREVLFLSPEPDKSLEYDHRSMLNLLYLYPRLLVLKSKDDSTIGGVVGKPSSKQGECPMRYTVRIRLIQSLPSANEKGVIGSHIEINTSFHNPASWGGSNLLRSVFTRIPTENSDSSFTPKGQPIDDPRAGIPLRDEFKMNLPTILDGRHYLQFSLFSVELNDYADEPSSTANVESCSTNSGEDCRISLRQIAETTIPLSSSSTRDQKFGLKATTVIPNGCHRLRLGDFQLQVETRLVSSIHVSDPAVAAVLRGFPAASIDGQIGNRGNPNNLEEMAITTSRAGRSTSSRGSETFPEKVSYSSLLSTASVSAMAGHFESLFFLHVRNLTKITSGQDIETSEKFIMNNMLSLLVLFQRVKSFKSRIDLFIKSTIDSFDEPSNYGITQGEATEDDSASDFFAEPKHKSSSILLDFVEEGEEEKFDGGAIRRRKRHSVSSDIDIRLSRSYSAIESSEVPFSRVAYGASKTDHMRLEAEMGGDQGRVTTLFDDDETVVTLTTTRHAEAQLIEARNTFEKTKMTSSSQGKSLNENHSPSFNSLEHAENQSKDPKEIGFAAYQHSMSELKLGKRMKSAAQVMLAPCVTVTPGLAAFLCRPTSRNASSTLVNSETKQDLTVSNSTKPNIEPIMEDVLHLISLPGSDLDDDDSILEKDDTDASPYHPIYGLFRGPRNCKKLEFSIQRDNGNQKRLHTIARGLYVYESIMVLWLQAWEDYVSTLHQNASNVINFLGEKDNDFAMFHLQIDILLPILLKSICLRYDQMTKNSKQKAVRCILDKDHEHVFESFVEMLAIGLMGQAMTELQQQTEYGTLDDAIDACDHVVDFLVGLFAIFHPAHMEAIISKFIMTLRSCETDHDGSNESIPFEWNETSLHRTKCSRQLRLRTVEKLAVLPNFVALNFPLRYSSKHFSSSAKKSSWTMQYGIDTSPNEYQDHNEDNSIGDGLIPRNGWLASILTNESLSMCALSCEAVVVEAIANIETQDSRNKAEKSIWPLRRSFADIEDANPLDDDRVDPQLSPILSVFCRASQAIIDGVLIEMRLRGDDCIVVGTRISPQKKENYTFDADEESLFEAANYFAPETAPMQRLRWLLTLKSLHEAKGHWIEAAESLIMCARTISDAIPHLKNAWRPTRFSLWSDGRRSLWLSTVGEAMGNPEQGNTQVMTFANSFLEPELIATPNEESNSLKLPQLNLEGMCSLLTSVSKEAVHMYGREGGMDDLAYTRLESLLKIVMGVFDDYEITCKNTTTRGDRLHKILQRKQYVEEVAYIRKVMASITGEMTKVAERLLLAVQDAPISSKSLKSKNEMPQRGEGQPYYVRLLLSGRKPRRFEESTTLPTYLEWNNPCICRVPKDVIEQASQSMPKNSDLSEIAICNAFGKRIRNALLEDLDATAIVFGTGITKPDIINPDVTYIDIGLVYADSLDPRRGIKDGFGHEHRRFRYSKPNDTQDGATTTHVEMTVAITFPCPLSRQRSMLTNEFVSSKFSME
ncbi:hypothetical protein FRACYDRAFT_250455 [Fragilariopsis cylindrus CCMP1102]|uniref:DOCKER Lobe A domain-containing protein n=1 Tax=Fragilariopsis cylindrus CCMP1102 TaxID=635003 RepID=A0A1E7EQK8_9STRA|nr:hypothetical protein FRACYDRAFT_250455 [Fragilariopsis cylindrus CCMP1102]|eukprot:OEU07833.1 hypothetical protein FRACYDRAFT_250455 [Fragilariopsis cylindrus CCMP1102]